MGKITILAIALAGWVGTANAGGSIVTPSMIGQLGDVLHCTAINATEKPQEIMVEMFNGGGAVIASTSCSNVLPFQTCHVSTTGVTAQVACRFIGKAKALRGNIQAFRSSFGGVYLGFEAR